MRAQSPLLRASVAPAAAISPLRVASRWYSESAEANKEEKKDEKKDEQKQEPAETDKLKEQLEAKNKEIVDLKVRLQPRLRNSSCLLTAASWLEPGN